MSTICSVIFKLFQKVKTSCKIFKLLKSHFSRSGVSKILKGLRKVAQVEEQEHHQKDVRKNHK